jgi:CheY-like chemotaxis protein
MSQTTQRRGSDRRRRPRGGRRAGDREGFAPLVMLVGDQHTVMDRSEAILAKLRFAVTTTTSAEQAIRLLPELKPDLIVAGEMDGARIRRSTSQRVTIVVVDRGMNDDPDAVIDAILRTLRVNAS